MTAESPARVFTDIAGTLEIPEDGTLSKVLYTDDQIRVVGFAFDVGQELTEHTATLPVLIQVISGRFRLTAGNDEYEIDSASWVHLAGSVPHSLYAVEPSRLLLTLLKAG